MKPLDTSDAAWEVQLELLRRKGPGGRARLAVEASEQVRALTRAGIAGRHPEYAPEQVTWAFRRLLVADDALYSRAWPGAPLLEP